MTTRILAFAGSLRREAFKKLVPIAHRYSTVTPSA